MVLRSVALLKEYCHWSLLRILGVSLRVMLRGKKMEKRRGNATKTMRTLPQDQQLAVISVKENLVINQRTRQVLGYQLIALENTVF